MNVEKEVIKIISNHLGVDPEEITSESYLQDDLNSDPLSMADLVVSLEDHFKIAIPSEETLKFIKVGDITDFIADKIGEV